MQDLPCRALGLGIGVRLWVLGPRFQVFWFGVWDLRLVNPETKARRPPKSKSFSVATHKPPPPVIVLPAFSVKGPSLKVAGEHFRSISKALSRNFEFRFPAP